MIETRFERVFKFFGGVGVFTFALGVDCLPKM